MSAATLFSSSASYPIKVGHGSSDTKNKDYRRAKWNSIRYNHKPRPKTGKDLSGRIKPGKDGSPVLSLREGGGGDAEVVFWYRGQSRQEKDSYVLVLKGEGDDKEMVLEKLGDAFAFNLFREPEERDAGKLEQKYPHISLREDEQEVVSANKADEAEDVGKPDDSNPFDYRHFIKAPAPIIKPAGSGINIPRASAARPTPRPNSVAKRQTEQQAQPAQKKRKTAPAPKPAAAAPSTTSKRPKPSPPPENPQLNTQQVPRLHLDRKASIRQADTTTTTTTDPDDDDDSGELILENDTSASSKPPSRNTNATSLALGGGLAASSAKRVPMSLHSAVSSPAGSGRFNSASPLPAADGASGREREIKRVEEGGYEFEFGVVSEGEEEEDGKRGEEEADADVEDLELPSPAAMHRPSSSRAQVVGQEGGAVGDGETGGAAVEVEAEADEEDDLERQMMMAMAEEGDDDAGAAGFAAQEESDEESEEE